MHNKYFGELMASVISETMLDILKMIPLLFAAYLFVEFIQNKSDMSFLSRLSAHRFFSPIAGSILGLIPQCGFSAAAAKLFSDKVITLGTLTAIFLSTSDEAFFILAANPEFLSFLMMLILIKIIYSSAMGIFADLFIRKKSNIADMSFCHEHEHLSEIFKCAFIKTLKTAAISLLAMLIINSAIYFAGEKALSDILVSGSLFQPVLSSLIGLIPGCTPSIILSELFISGHLSFGSLAAGISSSAGIGFLVLFKENKSIKTNILILLYCFLSSVLLGVFLHVII